MAKKNIDVIDLSTLRRYKMLAVLLKNPVDCFADGL